MKRTAKLAALLTVGATTAIGVVVATGSVSAAASGGGNGSPWNGAGGYSTMMGSGAFGRGGMMRGWAGNGIGMMGADGVGMMGTIAVTAPSGTLSAAQKTALAQAAEQQQLAENLYQAFAGHYGNVMFDHLADDAGYQLDSLRTLLTRYGLSDPTAGKSAGSFSDPATQATYNRLLASGGTNYSDALAAAHSWPPLKSMRLRQALLA